MPKNKGGNLYMDEFLILLQAKLDEAKSKGNVNADIDKLQSQLDKLKIQVELDPKAAQKLADSIGKLINQKIVISNIGIDTNAGIKVGQEYGKQVSQGISQGMSSAPKSTEKVLRDFSELNDAKRKFVDGHDLISKDDIADAERLYDTVRKAFSEFGQVTVSKGSMNDGSLENMRVKIEQVNGEMKNTRDFMLYFNESKNGFKLVDDDTIRTTEKMIQHLNEEKNIINATNEEANAIKEKLAEQEKYYGKLGQATKEQIALEKQRITAGEKQLEILEEQTKRRDSRISYNEGQIDKKGLFDITRQRKQSDLEYSGQEKLDIAFGKEIDKSLTNLSKLKEKWQEQGIYVDEFKSKVELLEKSLNEITIGDVKGLNSFKEQISSLTTEAKQLSQIHEIQLSMDNGHGASEYQNRINAVTASLDKYGVEAEEAKNITSSLQSTFDSMKGMSGQELVDQADKLEQEFKAVKASVEQAKIAYDKYMQPVSNEKATSLINRINTFLSKNTRITNDAKIALQGYADELGRGVNLSRWNEINGKLKETENSMRGLHRLGASLKDQMSQAAQSFTQWLSVSSVVMLLVSKIKNAITELKEVNTLLTEISKANDKLSKSDLDKIGNNSFDVASKYGKSATDYLSGVQEASRAGYENAEGIAELSVAAQGAGDMTAELSNQMIIAVDKAYKMNGSITELTQVLDGMNYITNHNAVNMTELSEAMSIVGSTAASFGVDVDETTAALGTMVATTQQSGSEVARAFKAILLNIRQVSDEEEGIDAEGLTKYENACNALNVKLKETRDGVLSLRDPMEVLKELSIEYNKLDESDIRRTNLLSSVGGKLRATQLDALLRQWDTYEAMLVQYADGTGSMAIEAEKTAKSWEGSMNRLGNTWKDTIENIANSDAIITIIDGLNSLLSVVNNVTDKLGSLGTIGLGAGLLASFKGAGRVKIAYPHLYTYACRNKTLYA